LTQRRAFRFGVNLRGARTAAEWIQKVRRAQAMGYSVVSMSDHFGDMGVIPALTAAAMCSPSIRIGIVVLNNDLRHPAGCPPPGRSHAELYILVGRSPDWRKRG